MVSFSTIILKFNNKGEKTGWTYIEVPADVAAAIKKGRKSFRVKGFLDKWKFSGISLFPSGDGTFIMPLNMAVRKAIGKKHGAMLQVKLEEDKNVQTPDNDLMECLHDDQEALTYFNSLTPSHRNYFSNWVKSAKTDATKTKRIARCINALSRKMDFGQMLREGKKNNIY